ncbi:ATPase [Aquibacillus sediminis]|uniref:ATPase n=1 Tax=Aquibacillus sediminis TaxID=2574734 RepID=UPI001FEAA0DC|nr:ATPase [Aquibacillus sediminis]
MKKELWIPLIVSFGTMVVLYFIGFLTNLELLVFHCHIPKFHYFQLQLGALAGFITERIIKRKSQI